MLTITDMGTGMLAKSSVDEDYGQEILGGEWNAGVPTMEAVAAELAGQLTERNAMPRDLLEMDVEVFLRTMYAAQQ